MTLTEIRQANLPAPVTAPVGGGGEALFQKRVDFHPARRSNTDNIPSSESRLETINPREVKEIATRRNPISIAPSKSRQETVNPREVEISRRSNPMSIAPSKSRLDTLNPKQAKENGWLDGGVEAKKKEGATDAEIIGLRIEFSKIGAGLRNHGNTCYLNSVLQVLTYTEPFAAYLQSGNHKFSCRMNGFCGMCAIQNHVTVALKSTGKILSPLYFVKNLRYISRNFRNFRQEDAHECMVNLLEHMHKCCLPMGVSSESPIAYENSLVHKIFGGCLQSQVVCMNCHHRSNKFDQFLDLSVEINKADTVHKALLRFTAFEELDGGQRQYQCEHCKQKVRAKKRLTMHKAPHILTIHLKRFGMVIPGQKIDKKVKYESILDLKPFMSHQQEEDLTYTLYGVLVHDGWSTQSGHYYCYVCTSNGFWYSLNDDRVSQVSEKVILEQKAYMLFYTRSRCLPSKGCADIFNTKNIPNASRCGPVVSQPAKGYLNGAIEKNLTFASVSHISVDKNVSINVTSRDISLGKQSSMLQWKEQSSLGEVSFVHRIVDQQKQSQQLRTQENQSKQLRTQENQSKQLRTQENQSKQLRTQENQSKQLRTQENQSKQLRTQENQSKQLRTQEKQSKQLKIQEKQSQQLRTQEKQLNGQPDVRGTNNHYLAQQLDSQKKQLNGHIAVRGTTNYLGNNVVDLHLSKDEFGEMMLKKLPSSSPYINDNMVAEGTVLSTEKVPGVLCLSKDKPPSSIPYIHNMVAERIVLSKEKVDSAVLGEPSASVSRVNTCNGFPCSLSQKHLIVDDSNGKYEKSKRQKHSNRGLFPFKSRNLLFASWITRKKGHNKRYKVKHSKISQSTKISMQPDQEPSTSKVASVDRCTEESTQKKLKAFKKLRKKRSRTEHGVVDLSSMDNVNAGNCRGRNIENHTELVCSKKPKEITKQSDASLLLHTISVPRWNDELPSSLCNSANGSIGYLLDERDEDYDRGRKKRVKRRLDQPSGSFTNPFQAFALRGERSKAKRKAGGLSIAG